MKKIMLEEHILLPGYQISASVRTLLNPPVMEYVLPRLMEKEEEERLEVMDQCAIEKQVLSPPPLDILTETDTTTAVEKAKHINDTLAETVWRHPDRFAGNEDVSCLAAGSLTIFCLRAAISL